MVGQRFLHYEILTKLGAGGMGTVYRARDTHLNRDVALKILSHEAIEDLELRRRFVNEARAASALNHSNIITIYDIAKAGGTDFIVMEYVAGRTLERCIGRKGLSLVDALNYAAQIADALARAHAVGIVHRDLKPANIMVTDAGLVKVLDFGLAKLTERPAPGQITDELTPTKARSLTQKGTVLGTMPYMSPEQAEGKHVDERSDIFSFGAVLYEMLTGRPAFRGETWVSILTAILHEEPERISAVLRGAPKELERTVWRCLRKDPGRRFQTMADLKVVLQELAEEARAGTLAPETAQPEPQRQRLWLAALAGAVAGALVIAGMALWFRKPETPVQPSAFIRVTSDSGLTTQPAISLDGKLVAYASDRSGDGNLDIYMQQLAGGEAIRLTHHPADDSEPSFAADSSKIVFRSDRDGGGVYIVSAYGGEERLIAREGRAPRFSPDGEQIAYWVGEAGSGDPTAAGSSRSYIVPVTGGRPIQLCPDFANVRSPIWGPEGKRLLFWGNKNTIEPWDWWVVTPDGRDAVRTEASVGIEAQKLSGSGLVTPVTPDVWIGDQVFFSASLLDSMDLWQVRISGPNWKVDGPLRRVTSGTSLQARASVAIDGQMVLASLTSNVDVWSLPIDGNTGRVTGPLARLHQDTALDTFPSVSIDGTKVAFISSRSGNRDLWLKDLRSGKLTALTFTPESEMYPKFSGDGTKLAYNIRGTTTLGIFQSGGNSIFIASIPGGLPERVCDVCGVSWSLSPRGDKILYGVPSQNRPFMIELLDVASGSKRRLISDPKHDLYQASFSPDGRWITFLYRASLGRSRIFIVPFRSEDPIPEIEWIAATDTSSWVDKPRFSPNSNLLYFLSDRDGFRCLWAQRLDPETKQPAGASFEVQHFHTARLSLSNINLTGLETGVARDKFVFNMGEVTGNIWTTKLEHPVR